MGICFQIFSRLTKIYLFGIVLALLVSAKAFAKKRILMLKEEDACLFQNEIDKLVRIKLLARWFKVAAKSSIKWASITKAWKNTASELTSTVFWQQYLGLKK